MRRSSWPCRNWPTGKKRSATTTSPSRPCSRPWRGCGPTSHRTSISRRCSTAGPWAPCGALRRGNLLRRPPPSSTPTCKGKDWDNVSCTRSKRAFPRGAALRAFHRPRQRQGSAHIQEERLPRVQAGAAARRSHPGLSREDERSGNMSGELEITPELREQYARRHGGCPGSRGPQPGSRRALGGRLPHRRAGRRLRVVVLRRPVRGRLHRGNGLQQQASDQAQRAPHPQFTYHL